MARIILLPGNEQKLQLLGLITDAAVFVNNAAVVATMNDLTGTVIPELNGVTLTSIDSTGDYSYTIPASFNVKQSDKYTCVITVTVGGVLKETIYQPVSVEPRTG